MEQKGSRFSLGVAGESSQKRQYLHLTLKAGSLSRQEEVCMNSRKHGSAVVRGGGSGQSKGADAAGTEGEAGVWAPPGVMQALHGDQVQGARPALELRGAGPSGSPSNCFRLSHPQERVRLSRLVPKKWVLCLLCAY